MRDVQVIIVDTSGRHKQEEALFDEMKEIQETVQPDNTTLIMDATQGQAVFDQAKAFHGVYFRWWYGSSREGRGGGGREAFHSVFFALPSIQEAMAVTMTTRPRTDEIEISVGFVDEREKMALEGW